ncbi:unnamed protein product [Mucor hiemalis]
MSFSRKSQKLISKVCRDCLSKRTVITNVVSPHTVLTQAPGRRFLSTVAVALPECTTTNKITPAFELLAQFRHDLYHTTDKEALLLSYSPPVRKTIQRREERKRIVASYRTLKAQQPAALALFTQHDVDMVIASTELSDAFEILQDVRKGKLFRSVQFRQEDAEKMIYLAIRMKYVKKAVQLLEEFSVQFPQLSIESYEAVIEYLATTNQQPQQLDHWIDYLVKEKGMVDPSKTLVRSFILSRVSRSQLEAAAQYLKQHHPTPDLAQLVTRHIDDDYELLDHALNIFAMDYYQAWRLEEMRQVYLRKKACGMSTSVIIKNLFGKSLHTGQVHTIAQRVFKDTLTLGDTANIQLSAKKLIGFYISKKDIKHAIRVWDDLTSHHVVLPQGVLQHLIIHAAKLKYHVDTMRIYQHYTDLYPNLLSSGDGEVHVQVLKCMVRSSNFNSAEKLQAKVESLLEEIKPNLARTAVRSLFSLAAQTGNVDMFERVFRKSEKLKLSLTHKGLTSLIACYLTRGDMRSAKAAFQSVASHTDGPDVVDFNLLMRTVVMEDSQGKDTTVVNYDKILDILQHMNMVNITPDETTMRTMLGFYKSESEMQRSIYDKLLSNPDAISRFDQVFLNNIALGSLLTRMDVEQVVGILHTNSRQALFPSEPTQRRIHVNGMTYKMLIDAANKDTRYTHVAERLFKDMHARGMKPSREVYTDLIHNLAKKGKIAKARKFIVKMEKETGEKATVKTWTHLVDGLLILGKPVLAKEIFTQDMKDLQLDEVACKKLKKIDVLLLSK